MSKTSKLQATLGAKCPRCHEGDVFKYPLSHISKFMAMHDHCPKCDLRYMREPGFFYGAMYIAYGFSVAIVLAAGLATYVLGNDPELWVYLTVVTIGLLIASPLSFRYARVLMLHIFSGVSYEPEAITEHS